MSESVSQGTTNDGQDSESLIPWIWQASQSGNYKSVEKKHKDDIVFSDQISSTYNLSAALTVDLMKLQLNRCQGFDQRILNKDFRQTIMFTTVGRSSG